MPWGTALGSYMKKTATDTYFRSMAHRPSTTTRATRGTDAAASERGAGRPSTTTGAIRVSVKERVDAAASARTAGRPSTGQTSTTAATASRPSTKRSSRSIADATGRSPPGSLRLVPANGLTRNRACVFRSRGAEYDPNKSLYALPKRWGDQPKHPMSSGANSLKCGRTRVRTHASSCIQDVRTCSHACSHAYRPRCGRGDAKAKP